DGEAQHRRPRDSTEAEQQRVPERAHVERVVDERDEVARGDVARLIGKGVVEDPQQRVDQEEDQEGPDGRITQRGAGTTEPGGVDLRTRRRRLERAHSSGSVSATDAAKDRRTAGPGGSRSWCHGSRTSTFSRAPRAVSTS